MKNENANHFAEGMITITAKGIGYVKVDDSEQEDIEIGQMFLNTALHGDRVRVFLHPEKEGQRQTGEVTEILLRGKMTFIGKIERKGNLVFLVADDRHMYTDIYIPHEKSQDAQNGQKAFVRIIDWTNPKKNPSGEVIKVIGNPGEHETEIEAIILEKGFELGFTPEVLANAESISGIITAEEIAKRRDMRAITTFTIDPFDAKDFDDAISFETLPNGDYEIGVHIADVSHFVTPGTALDKEARLRGTSVYLVDRCIPMLPERLSNDLCSLKPNEDRLAFSAIFTVDKNCVKEGTHVEVKKQWFGKTVIHSDRRFTYEEAQEVLEGKQGGYPEELLALNAIAKNMTKARYQEGAISFEQDEIKIILDENGVPVKIIKKQRKDAHKLVEEFMLLANKKVAEYIAHIGKAEEKLFVYRIHNEPDKERIRTLAVFLKTLGFTLKLDENGGVSTRDLNDILSATEGGPFHNLVHTSALRTMSKAIYSTKNVGHYGLGFEHYTHFTSPIRRYPDVLSHRLLFAHLKQEEIPDSAWHDYEAMLVYATEREIFATDAERASIKWKQVQYMETKVGQEFEATITGVTEWGIYVEEKETRSDGMIRMRDLSDDFYILDEKNYCLIGKNKKKKYALGDVLKVKLTKANVEDRQLDFAVIS
ncbi:MAG: ribonuclease R [Candidatus Parcubacteria bacterium]|nr:ribonuclease R [Candidatus Parcubacteria bacterium]